MCMTWYSAWQNSWLHYIDKLFWSLHDHALSSASLAIKKIAWMSNFKHPCLPYMITIARILSAPRYMFGICLLEALHTRDQVSHVSTEHPRPGSSARTFFGRSRVRQSGSHKTGSISASTASSRLRIPIIKSCVTNLIRVPQWFFATAWYTLVRRQNRPPLATPCLSEAVLAQGPRPQY